MGRVTNVAARGGGANGDHYLYNKADEVIFSGYAEVPANFLGMHFHRWPTAKNGTVKPDPTFSFNTWRTHDYGVAWYDIETSKGVYDWSYLDATVAVHHAAGRKFLFTVYGTPTWAATAAGQTRLDRYGKLGGADKPADLNDLANFVTTLVTRYQGKLLAIESWNEPYFTQDWTGFFWGSAADLAAMTRTIKIAAKAVDPTLPVISPGFTNNGPIPDYLVASDGAGGVARDHIDGVGIHFYDVAAHTEYPGRAPVIQLVRMLHDYFKNAGMPVSTPIWDTEHGWGSSPWQTQPELIKARDIRRIAAHEAALGVKTLCWYAYDNAFTFSTPMLMDSPIMCRAMQDCHDKLSGRTIHKITALKGGLWEIITDAGNLYW